MARNSFTASLSEADAPRPLASPPSRPPCAISRPDCDSPCMARPRAAFTLFERNGVCCESAASESATRATPSDRSIWASAACGMGWRASRLSFAARESDTRSCEARRTAARFRVSCSCCACSVLCRMVCEARARLSLAFWPALCAPCGSPCWLFWPALSCSSAAFCSSSFAACSSRCWASNCSAPCAASRALFASSRDPCAACCWRSASAGLAPCGSPFACCAGSFASARFASSGRGSAGACGAESACSRFNSSCWAFSSSARRASASMRSSWRNCFRSSRLRSSCWSMSLFCCWSCGSVSSMARRSICLSASSIFFRASLNSCDWMFLSNSLISRSFFCSCSWNAWRSAAWSRLSRICLAASSTCCATACWRSAAFFISSERSNDGFCALCAWVCGCRSSLSSDFWSSFACSAAFSRVLATSSCFWSSDA